MSIAAASLGAGAAGLAPTPAPVAGAGRIAGGAATPSTRTREAALQQAKGFEQILIGELCQELAGTLAGTDGSSTADGSSTDESGSSSDGASADPGMGMYSDLVSQALSTGVESAGGLGLAQSLTGSPVTGLGAASTAPAGTAAVSPLGLGAPSPMPVPSTGLLGL